jgi:hypothetical protein
MPRFGNATALTSNTWTRLFHSSDHGGNDGRAARAVRVDIPAGSANAVEVFVDEVHGNGSAAPGGAGYSMAAGSGLEFIGASEVGGTIKSVWARSAGGSVNYTVTAA